jgi:hypothetical protein
MSWRLFFKDRKIFTGDLTAYELIGEGTIRRCYRVPDQPHCLKFYASCCGHDPSHPRSLKTRLRLRLTKHSFWANINMQEWRYYERLKKRLPVALMSAFPEHMEPLYSPRYGWGLCETLLLNDDGSYARLAAEEIARLAGSPEAEKVYRAVHDLFDQAVQHAVALYDPRNTLVQWVTPSQCRIRVVDFEPKAKAAVPGLTYCKAFVRYRVHGRSRQYLKRLQEILVMRSATPWTSSPPAGPSAPLPTDR